MVQFNKLLGNRSVIKLLEFFSDNPTASLSQTDIIKKTKVGKVTAMVSLRKLEQNGILGLKQIGRTKLYSLRREDFFVKQLRRFFNLTSPMVEDLIGKIKDDAHKVIVFGSFARGEDREDSDIDIVVVGDIPKKEITAISDLILEKYGKRLSVIVKTNEEFINMPKREPILWNKLLEGGEALYEA